MPEGARRRGAVATAGGEPGRAAVDQRVIGTAGHIDHGKSALVLALTGTDPDRLAEEKRRGMTIDLGFASWPLPSGRRVGVIDVPGHRRFVRTMVAGAQGVDLVVLVVAATEGVMPQTREHVAICALLGIGAAVVALTKADLVDADTVELARIDVRELLEATPYVTAPIIACSAVTHAGLDELATAVDAALASVPARRDREVPRLFVDRAFSIAGFGPVVTGTLENGSLGAGDEVLVLPTRLRARVRGLQQHGAEQTRIAPGSRTAVNLSGVDRADLHRGLAVVRRGTIGAVSRVDCSVIAEPDDRVGLRHRERLELHLGTAEVEAALWLLEGGEIPPGSSGFAQLRLQTPVAAMPGDRFVLRRAAESATVGGGEVLAVSPRRHRRRDPAVAAALERRREGGAAAVVLEELRDSRLGLQLPELVARTGAAGRELEALLRHAGGAVTEVARRWFASDRWRELGQASAAAVAAHHEESPLQPGLARDELDRRLQLGRAAGPVVDALITAGVLVESRGALALPGRGATPSLTERPDVAAVLTLLRDRGLDTPDAAQLRTAGLTPELLRLLVNDGLVVRLGDGQLLATDTYARARDAVVAHLRQNDGATVAVLRDVLGATRRVVVPLLERLDAERVTVRNGDLRRLSASRRGD